MQFKELKRFVAMVENIDDALAGKRTTGELKVLMEAAANRALLERRQNLLEKLERSTGINIDEEV